MLSFFRRSHAALLLVGVLVASPILAQSMPNQPSPAEPQQQPAPRPPLTLAQALEQALARHPALQGFPYALRAADAAYLQAGLLPNPEIGLDVEDFGGNGSLSGSGQMQTTLSVSQLLPLGGKRMQRQAVADASRQSVSLDYQIARLEVLTDTATRVLAVAAAEARLTLAERTLALADSTFDTASRQTQAGARSAAEVSRAKVEQTNARLDLEAARQRLETARLSLAASWGDTQADFGDVTADLANLPPLQPFAHFAEAVKNSPTWLRLASDTRLREAELALARAEAKPGLTLGVGIKRLEAGAGGKPDYGLVASLRMPLTLFDRNQGNLASAKAQVLQAQHQQQLAWLRLHTTLNGLYREAQQARRNADLLTRQAIPAADRALQLTERGYRAGRLSLLELLAAQQQAMELRARVINAQVDAHQLDADIERLTAEPIVAPLPPVTEP